MRRVEKHPVIEVPKIQRIAFRFQGKPLTARRGEMISSALFANGIHTFGLHPHDGAPQGIFCANGQCAQCLVIANGRPVKACMEPIEEGMEVQPLVSVPGLPDLERDAIDLHDIEEIACDLLIVGGGPSGLGGAIEAADAGMSVIVVDDKDTLGGKLVLQTHPFFGSVNDCYAGTRGIDIAKILANEVMQRKNITIMSSATAVGVFAESKVGIVSRDKYTLIKPKSLLVAAGAREKALVFPGCDLPGVYGAGAFQTILNRDLVRPSERLFIVGGGNVGTIAGYHAIQAGIAVVGLIEAMPDIGGYWVHGDKLRRLGVPIYTSTTVVSANGKDSVESVTVAEVDDEWNVVPGTYRTFACDTILIAVGLESISEFHHAALKFGLDSHVAGDAEEIAEASAAMFSGRLVARKIAKQHGYDVDVPKEWETMTELLKSKPGRENIDVGIPQTDSDTYPVMWCTESIPCNPCSEVCSEGAIKILGGGILEPPEHTGACNGCAKCVIACPALAITLVDRSEKRVPAGKAHVIVPIELLVDFKKGDTVRAVGGKGEYICDAPIVKLSPRRMPPLGDKTVRPSQLSIEGFAELVQKKTLVTIEVDADLATKIAGFRIQDEAVSLPIDTVLPPDLDDNTIVCRCERISLGQIRDAIRGGVRDMNQLKAMLTTGMGACGGKTCGPLIHSIFRQEGIPREEVTGFNERPLMTEVPLGLFAGVEENDGEVGSE